MPEFRTSAVVTRVWEHGDLVGRDSVLMGRFALSSVRGVHYCDANVVGILGGSFCSVISYSFRSCCFALYSVLYFFVFLFY